MYCIKNKRNKKEGLVEKMKELQRNNEVILVLGMHRSATSLTTRLLYKMGVYLGEKEDLIEAKEDNPEGFFERKDVVELNDNMLLENDMMWRFFRKKFLPVLHTEHMDLLGDILDSMCKKASGRLIGIKDPRLCILEQLWHMELQNKGLHERVVVVFRHPYEVARSLEKRDGMDFNYALKLWYYYNHSILNTVIEFEANDVLYINHNEYFQHPECQIRKIAQFLHLDNDSEKYLKEINKNLRHNYVESIEENVLYKTVILLYDYFVRLEKGEAVLCRKEVETFNNYWEELFSISYDKKRVDMLYVVCRSKKWCLYEMKTKNELLAGKFQDFFSKNEIREISIYGDGTIAEELYGILERTGIRIKCIYDRRPRRNGIQIGGRMVSVVCPDSADDLQSDFIINTVVNYVEELSEMFSSVWKNQKVIELSDLLCDFIL